MSNHRIVNSAERLYGADSRSDRWRWRAMNFFDNTTFNNAMLLQRLQQRKRAEQRKRLQELAKGKENQSVGFHKPQVMEEETNCGGMLQRPWDKLLPEILELIFRHCSLQEKLSVIPSVCKSWGRVVGSPYFWQHIDIMKWSTDGNVDEKARIRMLRMLLMRNNSSGGLLKTLSVCCVDDAEIFSIIANHAQNLENLKMPMSFIKDSIVIENASKLSNLRYLDVSYCDNIGAPTLEAIGKQCKYLTGLRRAMLFSRDNGYYFDDEALAIAATMPKLKRLEIPRSWFISMDPVFTVLSCCTQLEFMDLKDSFYVNPIDNRKRRFICIEGRRTDVVFRLY